jgi:hypothetical protein
MSDDHIHQLSWWHLDDLPDEQDRRPRRAVVRQKGTEVRVS